MTIYILILFASVDLIKSGNSNFLTTVEYSSKSACEAALDRATKMSGNINTIKGVCTEK